MHEWYQENMILENVILMKTLQVWKTQAIKPNVATYLNM